MLKLENGKAILLEIKYVLNWVKSCQARFQLQRFFIEELYIKPFYKKYISNRPEGALIVFHHFSSDWGKHRSNKRKNLDGWNRFYEEENIFRGSLIKTAIVQLKDQEHLTPYPNIV